MNPQIFELSIEQQFQLKSIEVSLETCEKSEMCVFILNLTRQIMVKDNLIKDLLKNGIKST